MSTPVITYTDNMSRWEPNARERLERAALELYRERGFDQTTVADIAERAGLTERTFFRYFADKREMLFGGQDHLRDLYVRAIENTPASAAPLDMVAAALLAAVALFHQRPDLVRQRQAVVDATPSLKERELLKRAALVAAMVDALRRRGVAESVASLAAEIGVIAFHAAYVRWLSDPDAQDFAQLIRASLDQIKAITQA